MSVGAGYQTGILIGYSFQGGARLGSTLRAACVQTDLGHPKSSHESGYWSRVKRRPDRSRKPIERDPVVFRRPSDLSPQTRCLCWPKWPIRALRADEFRVLSVEELMSLASEG